MPEFRSVRAPSYDVDGLVAKLNEAASDGWDVVTVVPSSSDLVAILRKGTAAPAAETPAAATADKTEPADEAAATPAAPPTEVAAIAAVAAAGEAKPEVTGQPTSTSSTDDALEAKVSDFLGTDDVEKRAAEAAAADKPAATEPAGWGTAPTPAAATPTPASPTPTPAPATAPTPSPAAPSPSPAAASPSPSPAASPASPSPASAPAAGKPATPAGWYPDPSGRYELRYWNGNDWSEHVARGGQQFTDPPVA